MNFNIVYGNHGGNPAVEDYLTLLRLTVEAAGHSAHFGEGLEVDHVNLILELFSPMNWAAFREVHEAGIEYIIVATEMITGGTFNALDFRGVHHYSNTTCWKERYDAFLLWSQHAKAIWLATSDKRQLDVYREKTGTPTCELRMPFFKDFHPLEHRTKDIDVFFSGSPTDYRKGVINHIRRSANVMHIGGYAARFIRDDYLSRSRVTLDIRLCKEYEQLSQMRVWYQLMNRCPVIAERPKLDAYLSPYVMQTTAEDMPTVCEYVLASDYQRHFAGMFEKFQDETDAKKESSRIMEETF